MRAVLARLCLATLVTLVMLGAAEGIARLVLENPVPLQPRQIYRARGKNAKGPLATWGLDVLMEPSPDPRLAVVHGEFYPDISFKVCYDASTGDRRPYMDEAGCLTIAINADRLRGPPVSRTPPPGTLRLVAVGDSFTFGDGVPFESTWPRLLEQRLDTALSNKLGARWSRCDSVNLGIPGYDVRDVHAYLRHRALEYSPDLLLYGFFLNDVLQPEDDASDASELSAAYRATFDEATGLARHSVLLKRWSLRKRKAHLTQLTAQRYEEAFEPESLAWTVTRRSIEGMKLAADARGVDLRIVLLPVLVGLDDVYPYIPLHRRLYELFDELEIPWYDVIEAWRDRSTRSLWVHDTDHHPNEIAQELAANYVFDQLADEFLAP